MGEGAKQVNDPDIPAEMGDEAEEESAAEGLLAVRIPQREHLRHEADEREGPDPETDPGEEVEDARERRQEERASQAHTEERARSVASRGGRRPEHRRRSGVARSEERRVG